MNKIKLNEELYNIAVDFRRSDAKKRTEILKNKNFTPEEIINMAEMQYIFIRDFDGIPRDILGKFCNQESMAAQDGLFLGSNAYISTFLAFKNPFEIFKAWYEAGSPIEDVTTQQYMAKKDW